MAGGEPRAVAIAAAVVGRDEADAAGQVLAVVQGDEALDPVARLLHGGERAAWILGPVWSTPSSARACPRVLKVKLIDALTLGLPNGHRAGARASVR
ncbi:MULTISPECIES: hypothetical protein [Sorangium]|uniref:hypothetical protein n=1 Tax=Sorangium TaxID=39643 RepID=UPI003D9C459A